MKHFVARLIGALSAATLVASAAQAESFKLIVTETETPLVPNSVSDLAIGLGYYKRAGVEVELIRVQQTPSAVAALRSGQGDMANVSLDTALQLVGRDQMKLKGVVSPDKALPFMIAAKQDVAAVKDLNGKVFGVARIGSADYTLSRVVLAKLGADPDSLRYLAVGQPPVRAQALAAGQIDATTISIGVWLAMPDKSGVREMVNQTDFYEAAPFVSKLNVVTDEVAKTKAKQIEGVVRGIILASRDFAKDPTLWVKAMEKARPDVKPENLEALGEAYRKEWSVNGGLNLEAVKFTTETAYRSPDFKDLRPVHPKEWIETSSIDAVLKDIGTDPSMDPTGR